MAKHTGKGSGKPAPEVVLSDKDTYRPQPEADSPKRPTEYAPSIGDSICSDISNGMSLGSALKPLDRPNARVWYEWLQMANESYHRISQKYAAKYSVRRTQ